MSKSLDNYIGISEEPFTKLEKSMKIPDDVLRQYFELATDLPIEDIDEIMNGDIREAHFRFAKELLKMYDDENEFEELKQRYLNIAKGGIPEDVEEMKVEEESANICDLLVKAGFATSRGDAKRMVSGNGVKVNGETITDITTMVDTTNKPVIQFGKNKFKRIIK